MKNDKESLSFGRYLQAIRLEKKISLEQVAEQTRIGLGNLLLVEQEDHEQLPAEVFVKGFLRSYAAAVGADGDEAVRRYQSRLGVVHKIAESEAAVGKSESGWLWKMLVSLGMLLCIIMLSIMAISFLRQKPTDDAYSTQNPAAVDAKPVTGAAQESVSVPQGSDGAVQGKLELQIIALEDTWIRVMIDGKDSTKYDLNSGDKIELEATTGYNLLIGNARGLRLTLNDKPIAVPGESGQVVTMDLP
jgi:cytoskeletal protein RodZ